MRCGADHWVGAKEGARSGPIECGPKIPRPRSSHWPALDRRTTKTALRNRRCRHVSVKIPRNGVAHLARLIAVDYLRSSFIRCFFVIFFFIARSPSPLLSKETVNRERPSRGFCTSLLGSPTARHHVKLHYHQNAIGSSNELCISFVRCLPQCTAVAASARCLFPLRAVV